MTAGAVASGRVLATSDCEHCRAGAISQPANAASSFAYVAAGLPLVRQARANPASDRGLVGWAAVAAGLGSVAYHGPGGVAGRWFHDAGLIALLGASAVTTLAEATERRVTPVQVAAVAAVAAVGAHPAATERAQLAAGAAMAVAEGVRFVRSDAPPAAVSRAPMAALLAGVGAYVAGTTSSRWCRPGSLAQPHAAWHALSAAAVWLRWREVPGADRPPQSDRSLMV